ncbi:MAG: hypothetical protein ABFC54_06085, partial [Thermoguttaceae bacterium]
MLRQFGWTAMVLLWTVGTLCAQNAMTTDERIAAWRTSSGVSQEKDAVRQASALEPIAPKTASPARFRDGSAALPNDAGQIWREYDISAYTTRVTTTKR